jgi:hypothetical protein
MLATAHGIDRVALSHIGFDETAMKHFLSPAAAWLSGAAVELAGDMTRRNAPAGALPLLAERPHG